MLHICIYCRGDRAFCSVDCRCKHILADEEEAMKKQNIFEEWH